MRRRVILTNSLNYENNNFFLTQDETRRLFDAISSKRDQAIFLTTYRHGLRASETGMLTKSAVDL
jgi:integrase